jgi:exopolysaccharide biosynthesis polyprenyl glycosylphosphotransferase
VSATSHTEALDGLLYAELQAQVSDRTREIIKHRRRTGVVRTRGWLVRRLLLAADLVGLIAALALAEWLVNHHNNMGVLGTKDEIVAFLLSLPAWVVVAKLYGLYDRDEERTDYSTVDEFAGVFHMVTVCTFLFWAFSYVTKFAHPTPPKLLVFWGAAVALVSVGRAVARGFAHRNVAYIQNTVIVGAGDVGQLIAKKLLNHPEYGINLVGFVDAQPKERREDLEHFALLGDTSRLPTIIRLFDVERVIVAFSNDAHEKTVDLIRSMKDLDVQIDIVPRFFEFVAPGMGIHAIEGLPLVALPPQRWSRSSKLLKRGLDVVVAAAGLIVLSPLFALIAILIKLESRGPVFFRQVRMGARDETFRIFKFRSMCVDADARKAEVAHLNAHLDRGGDPRMFKIPDDPRATRVGKCLRRRSFDELPQLINVLLGDMSLVGPRPLILDEDQYVGAWARRRLDLKPGMTGLWQVLGRSSIPFEEMVNLDYMYVTGWSLGGDLRLLARTLPLVASGTANR